MCIRTSAVICFNLLMLNVGSFGPSNCSDTVGKCFMTPFGTYLKPLPWYLSCSLRWFLISNVGKLGIWEGQGSELCVPLGRITFCSPEILLNVLFQGSFHPWGMYHLP